MGSVHIDNIQRSVDEYVRVNGDDIRILDAGCGCKTRIRFPEDASIIGIDIDADELASNDTVDEKIVGDIQTYDSDAQYDITICWNLLEHLDRPEQALKRLLKWTRPGGLIIITAPNALSLKGLITKLTPLWFHEWVYRSIYRYDGLRPFKTYMRLCISPGGLRSFFRDNRIEYMGFEDHVFFNRLYNAAYRSVIALIRVLSLRTCDPSRSQIFLVVKKAPPGTDR